MIRRILQLLTVCSAACASTRSPVSTRTLPADVDQLKRYAFAACLQADGIRSPSVARSLSLNKQESRSPEWRFHRLDDCARSYLATPMTGLVADLGLERCLDFLASAQLVAAIAATQPTNVDCRADRPITEDSRSAPTID